MARVDSLTRGTSAGGSDPTAGAEQVVPDQPVSLRTEGETQAIRKSAPMRMTTSSAFSAINR